MKTSFYGKLSEFIKILLENISGVQKNFKTCLNDYMINSEINNIVILKIIRNDFIIEHLRIANGSLFYFILIIKMILIIYSNDKII